jgi:hypothetical protein
VANIPQKGDESEDAPRYFFIPSANPAAQERAHDAKTNGYNPRRGDHSRRL